MRYWFYEPCGCGGHSDADELGEAATQYFETMPPGILRSRKRIEAICTDERGLVLCIVIADFEEGRIEGLKPSVEPMVYLMSARQMEKSENALRSQ